MTYSIALPTQPSFSLKALFVAIAAQSLLTGYSHAAPTGGAVVAGGGSISQTGNNTQINQTTDRLSLQWDTFNVSASERVEFVQPSSSATALNRILDNNGSRILGQIEANGHVILMNPNGIFFGQGATVNVGGLVASGLNINTSDFMNGDLKFSEIAGSDGTVVNRGLINAASGGNVALIGKQVSNFGLVSAHLGHVALAAGSEAVVTFDDQGLIGVRIDKETLASEVGGAYAVTNTGTVDAAGGKILLNASVSADLFSEAVNHGEMSGGTEAILHSDGSFTLGAGHAVVNRGTLDVSSDAGEGTDGGYAVMSGSTVRQQGTIRANSGTASNKAGQVYLEATDQVQLTRYSHTEANSDGTAGGKVSLDADNIVAAAGATVNTTGNTLVSSTTSAVLPTIQTNHTYISSIGDVRQNGALNASGNTHLDITADADVRLLHADNDLTTLSAETGYTTSSRINDANDLELGDLNIVDSTFYVESLGAGATVSQSPNSEINVDSSGLYITADNIELGGNGSSTDLYYSEIQLNFTQHISTHDSINLIEDELLPDTNSARIVGRGDGTVAITLRGSEAIDLDADINSNDYSLVINNMVGNNATLEGLFETEQTGPITLSGALIWNSYRAILDNPENDVAALRGEGAIAFGELTYVDKNDIVLQELSITEENELDISSVGVDAQIRQAPNSVLRSDFINLSAANINLGANGTSQVSAGYSLEIDFSNLLNVNGPYSVGSYAPDLRITGDDNDNRMVFGEFATTSSFSGDDLLASINIDLKDGNDQVIFDSEFIIGNDEYFSTNQLNMGAGNDRVYMNRDVYIPVTLGEGNDLYRIWDFDSYFNVTDFDYNEDMFLVANPYFML